MIKKIVKLKDYYIFQDFSWSSCLSDFKKTNIIYGFNGSGKSTLSELFRFLEKKDNNFLDNGACFDFEMFDDSHIKSSDSDLLSKGYNIKVFNQNFIRDNIDFIKGNTNKIDLLIKQGNEDQFKEIDEKNKEINKLDEKISDNSKDREGKIRLYEKIFTEIARTISAAETGNARRNYKAPEAKLSFALLKNKEELNDEELEKNKIIVSAESRDNISDLSLDSYKVKIESIKSNINKILEKKIIVGVIERLKDNVDISQWVESGLVIHKKHESNICEYCGQEIQKKRQEELENYFNDEDRKLKLEINNQINSINVLYSNIESIILPDENKFYPDKKQTMISYKSIFTKEKGGVLLLLNNFKNKLEEKKSKQFEELKCDFNVDVVELFDNIINQIRSFIDSHNNFNAGLVSNIENARKKIEMYFLSTIFDEVNKLKNEISELTKKIDSDKKDRNEKEKEVGEIRNLISSVHASCGELNKNLHQFLGRDEIVLEVTDDKQGFAIKRGDKNATNLSEGEKTAIAFVYFLMSLFDDGFDIRNGIIVIDDPISSLDSNSSFQAFSFMKEKIKEAKQIFIMTHNFQFLRMILNWQQGDDRGRNCSTYMINNYIDNSNNRCAKIEELDILLRKHETEYHYLFKVLYDFNNEPEDKKNQLARVYNLPNIARKVLDTFLMFRVPNNEGTFKKLNSSHIVFDGTKKTAIFKFSNDQSHITGDGFDPSLIQETKNNVRDLLEMIEKNSKEHYDIIINSFSSSNSN